MQRVRSAQSLGRTAVLSQQQQQQQQQLELWQALRGRAWLLEVPQCWIQVPEQLLQVVEQQQEQLHQRRCHHL